MVRAGLILGLLAVVLAWPVPVVLIRARWTARSPALALVLWQAIALSGGMCMIGALLAFGLAPAGDDLPAAIGTMLREVTDGADAGIVLGLAPVFSLCAAVLLGGHLLLTLGLTWRRITQRRRAHREALRLLSDPTEPADTIVVDHPTPLAYCLPGGTKSVTVLSDGLLQALRPRELDAVLAHERAHLTQHHHVLLLAFAAWRSSLPWLPTSRLALGAVTDLVEMLADDDALRTVDRRTLIRAIAVVGGASRGGAEVTDPIGATADPLGDGPGGALGDGPAAGRVAPARVSRLLHPQPPLGRLSTTSVGIGSVALVLAPALLLI